MVALMQPHNQTEFPLLTNFTVSFEPLPILVKYSLLQRVTPRPNSVLSQELFVFHKCALIE